MIQPLTKEWVLAQVGLTDAQYRQLLNRLALAQGMMQNPPWDDVQKLQEVIAAAQLVASKEKELAEMCCVHCGHVQCMCVDDGELFPAVPV